MSVIFIAVVAMFTNKILGRFLVYYKLLTKLLAYLCANTASNCGQFITSEFYL